MANEQNLVPFTSDQSREEAAKNGQKGGIASGIARRRKRSLREAADLFLSLPVAGPAKDKMKASGLDPNDIDNQMAMIVGLTVRATKGDARAAKVLIDILGEDVRAGEPGRENNLLEAIKQSGEEIDTDDLPEVE